MEVIAVVKEVTRKNIEPKNGAAPFTLYEIEAGDHTWTTKKQEIALTAHSLVGKTALINGKINQKGHYTNYYIDSIEETDAAVPTGDLLGETLNGNGPIESRSESIHRQVATKVAAQLADNPVDFWQNVDTLMRFYSTGVHPGNEGEYAEEAATEAQDAYGEDIPFN